jgi:hypothetical protein
MSLHRKSDYGWLFNISSQSLKGYGFFLFGLTMTCLLATILGLFPVVQALLTLIGTWIIRILGILVALVATGAIWESFRN